MVRTSFPLYLPVACDDDKEPVSAPAAAPIDVERVFQRYSAYVAMIALRILGNNDEVDDVVQDVFVSALSGLSRLQQPDAIRGWLATVTVRHASRRLQRRRLRWLLHLDRRASYDDIAAPGATPEQRALLAAIYRALDTLPVAERLAWTLRHLEGEQVDVVAQRCGCSLATAKRRIAAAQAVIERLVADE
jgi:RNA polymerase sigma-70 factor (ECF subfamily)